MVAYGDSIKLNSSFTMVSAADTRDGRYLDDLFFDSLARC
jgi:hypothetical protein